MDVGRRVRVWLAIGLACLCFGRSWAEAPRLRPLEQHGRPPFRLFTDRDGLPQNSVEAITVDQRGYLWVGTQDGPARYNGRTWTSFRLPKAELGGWIRCILSGSDGSIWFGRNRGGVVRLTPQGTWESHAVAPGVSEGRVSSLMQTADGQILVGTDRGVFRWDGRRWEAMMDPSGRLLAPVLGLAEQLIPPGGRSVLWVGTERGVARVEEGHWVWMNRAEGLPSEEAWCLLPTVNEQGDPVVWAGTGAGLAWWDGRRWKAMGSQDGLPVNAVNQLVEVQRPNGDRVIYGATDGGIVIREAGRWRTLSTANGLPNQVIRSLLVQVDPGGYRALWAGTFGGLLRLAVGGWQTFDRQAGLPDNVVFALAEEPGTGSIWVGTLGGGLAHQTDRGWESFGPESRVPDRNIMSLLFSELGGMGRELWIGTRGSGILRMRGASVTRYGRNEGLSDNWIYTLAELPGRGGRELWAGTRQGAVRWAGARWEGIPEFAGTDLGVVLKIEADPEHGRTWIASRSKGLFCLEAGRVRQMGLADGLPDERINSLCKVKDAQGVPWLYVATYAGLGRIRRDGLAARAETLPFLDRQIVYTVQADATGRIYAFTHRGVVQFTQSETGFRTFTFTTGDGLPSNGCTQGSSFVDSRGRIWTGTVMGAAVFNPLMGRDDRTQKPLIIEDISAGDNLDPPPPGFELPWRRPRMAFEFALLSFFREEDTAYRSQLVGLESEPTAWAKDSKREFPTLPPGEYAFKVWGRDYMGNISGPVSFPFRVQPAPWQTWWARLLGVGALVALVITVVRVRTRILHERTQELERKVAERTQELARVVGDLEEAREDADLANQAKSFFLATMSHEIRTPLNGILGLSGMLADGAGTPAERELAGVIHGSGENLLAILNEILDFSKVEAGSLELENSPFDPVRELEECLSLMAELAQRKGLELLGEIDPGLPSRVMGDPGRLRQVLVNLISNAVKFTAAGFVALRVRGFTEGDWLHLHVEVQDSGIGIPAEVLPKLFTPYQQAEASTSRRFGGTGLGLAICRRLVERMGGSIRVESQMEKGTSFRFDLPFLVKEAASEPLREFRGRVLLWEAWDEGRRVLATELESLGFRVEAEGLREAFLGRLAQPSTCPDLAVCTLPLEETDPLAWLSGLRRDLAGPLPPLLLLVGFEAWRSLGTRQPPQGVRILARPWKLDRLREELRWVLDLEHPAGAADSGAESQRLSGRVLVVDDNETNRLVAQLQLNALGLEVETAANALGGMERIDQQAFDVILMDCEMPDIDGFEATRRLRAKGCTLPILALTAHSVERARERCKDAGMDGFLVKPLRREALRDALRTWVEGAPPAPEVEAVSGVMSSGADLGSQLDPETWKGLEFLERVSGPGAIADVVDGFRKDVETRLGRMRAALAAQDRALYARLSHDLKSNAGTLGAQPLVEVARHMELEAESMSEAEFREGHERIEWLIPRVLEAIQQRLG